MKPSHKKKSAAPKPPSPEREFFADLVGKLVRVYLKEPLGGGAPITHGILRWVDTYTIGVSDYPEGHVLLLFKSAIVAIETAAAARGPSL